MIQKSFFFYDLETSGLNPRDDRIMQFAGQRTDLELRELGEPINLLVKLNDDTLPSPMAVKTTGITPQATQADGLTEAELAHYLQEKVFTPDTISVGFNTVRFDDEFMRCLFWRTFYDPYEWQWKDGRSRWDLLDLVRTTRALRPEGIKWPLDADAKPVNRLELITKLNGIAHQNAHDALSDVRASIEVARLLKRQQGRLFDYLLKLRDKREVQKLANLDNKQPLVYVSGAYNTEFNKATVVFPLAPARNGNLLVFDLRYNLEQLKAEPERESFYPIVKSLAYNKCPAVAPLTVLDKAEGWKKIGLDKATIEQDLRILLKYPEFAEQMRSQIENKEDWPKAVDAESALYDGFLADSDRSKCAAVRNAQVNQLADFHPEFSDERLPELLLHYKAKNYPAALSAGETMKWEKYRLARLRRQLPGFMKDLQKLQAENVEAFLVEELSLWCQSLLPSDA